MKNNKLSILLVIVILCIISFIFILFKGKTYTFNSRYLGDNIIINSIDDVDINIEQDKEIIKIIDTKVKNNKVELKIKSVNEGKAFININIKKENMAESHMFYVHKFGIISFNNYFGDFNGDFIIPISISILIAYILFILIKKYKQNISKNIYQYKNIAHLGLIIFLLFSLINQICSIWNYNGLLETVNDVLDTMGFSIVLLPVAFIVSVFVIINNIILIKKEGFSFKRLLGLLLSIFICFMTCLPDLLNNYLHNSNFIDIHNENSIGPYLQELIEAFIYGIVVYLECILLGTIIMIIKTGHYKPEYDKDYIIILGSKIRKDGTLTPLLKGRVDKAIEFRNKQLENTNKDLIFIVSGGKGSDEVISEADAMKNYLLEQGINKKNIIVEDKSINTYQNIKNSYEFVKEDSKIIFSTTNYHVFRAGSIAYKQNINIEGIGSKTKIYFWINAFIREFIATMYQEKKKNIFMMILFIIISIILIRIKFLANTM